MKSIKVIICILSFAQLIKADELFMSFEEAKEQGYTTQVSGFHLDQSVTSFPQAHQLEWPFEKPYEKSFIGNNFVQYQPYRPLVGYHYGSDMILEEGSWVTAPVSGRLEGGHYGYTGHENGGRTKHWKPWPADGSARYFEIAVVDDNDFRYEFHHIDKVSLPQDIIDGLNTGNARVEKGQRIGQVVTWGTWFHYHHIHVNVIGPKGIYYNPEHFFHLIPDNIASEVKFLLEYEDGASAWVDQRKRVVSKKVKNIVLMGKDFKNNHEYYQAPVFVQVKFDGGGMSQIDFRLSAYQNDGSFADIREIYPKEVLLPDQTVAYQNSDYYPTSGKFQMAIPLPEDTGNGTFEVIVEDIAGNQTTIQGTL